MILFETPRLIVRQWTEADYPAFHALFSDPDVMRFVESNRPMTETESAAHFAEIQQSYRDFGFGGWAIIEKVSQQIIGTTGLERMHASEDVEILYIFKREFWGKGYAYEVAAFVLQLGFERFNLPRIFATIDPENYGSIRVAEKLGMSFVRQDKDEHDLPIVVYIKYAS